MLDPSHPPVVGHGPTGSTRPFLGRVLSCQCGHPRPPSPRWSAVASRSRQTWSAPTCRSDYLRSLFRRGDAPVPASLQVQYHRNRAATQGIPMPESTTAIGAIRRYMWPAAAPAGGHSRRVDQRPIPNLRRQPRFPSIAQEEVPCKPVKIRDSFDHGPVAAVRASRASLIRSCAPARGVDRARTRRPGVRSCWTPGRDSQGSC